MIKKFVRLFFFIIALFVLLPMAKANSNAEIAVYSFDEFSHWLARDSDSIYVINFWATWCAPCVKEIPDFEKLHKTYESQKVKVLFVNLDFPTQLESRVIPFMERMDMQAHVVMLNDPRSNRWIPLVDEQWSGAIPATIIYGRGFREFYEREFVFEELENIVVPLLN